MLRAVVLRSRASALLTAYTVLSIASTLPCCRRVPHPACAGFRMTSSVGPDSRRRLFLSLDRHVDRLYSWRSWSRQCPVEPAPSSRLAQRPHMLRPPTSRSLRLPLQESPRRRPHPL